MLRHGKIKVFETVSELQFFLKNERKEGKKVGFVPTMGALHAGHISLIKESNKKADLTVCSIFVNPTQFNDPKDFERYPNKLRTDQAQLQKAGCDVLFAPSVAEIYPRGTKPKKPRKFGFIAQTLEGEFRPGHFEGMVQVVERLLDIVQPDFLFMGQKDYQQQLIVGQLIRQMKIRTQLVVCPILREKSGLAMSSRNARLKPAKRKAAAEISKTLTTIKQLFTKKRYSLRDLEDLAFIYLQNHTQVEPEYFEIRNARTLKPGRSGREKLVALTAVWLDGVRLIDNMLLN